MCCVNVLLCRQLLYVFFCCQCKVIRHYHGHLSAVYDIDLHPTIDVLVTCSRDATARVSHHAIPNASCFEIVLMIMVYNESAVPK